MFLSPYYPLTLITKAIISTALLSKIHVTQVKD